MSSEKRPTYDFCHFKYATEICLRLLFLRITLYTGYLTKKSPAGLDDDDDDIDAVAKLTRLTRFLALTSVTSSFSDCGSYFTPNQTRPIWLSGGS